MDIFDESFFRNRYKCILHKSELISKDRDHKLIASNNEQQSPQDSTSELGILDEEDDEIFIPEELSGVQQELNEYIHQIFDHLRSSYREEFKPDEKYSLEDIEHLFYTKYFKPSSIYIGKEKERKTDFNFLLKEITEEVLNTRRNKVRYLIGGVGSGKTSLINYLITSHFPPLVKSEKIIFIRIDLNYEKFKEDMSISKLMRHVNTKLKRILKDRSRLYNYNVIKNELDEIYSKTDEFEIFCETLLLVKKKRKLVLIFDNMDSIVHQYDRGLFKSKENKALKKLLSVFGEFIDKFDTDNGFLGSSLSAYILFVMRDTTSRFIIAHDRYSGKTDRYGLIKKYYKLAKKRYIPVLTSRNKLFYDVVTHDKPGDTEFENIIINFGEETIGKQKETLPPLKFIYNITNNQLRDIVEFMKNYVWINFHELSGPDVVLLEKEPLATIAYILGGKRLYSEELSKFPNIFLVEGDNAESKSPLGHSHTYWLKYLIMSLLLKKNEMKSSTKIDSIYRIFSTYDKSLIQSALGSLTDVLTSNLIKVTDYYFGSKQDKSKIRISKKGKECMENLFFNFRYLQLIVDDYSLAIPNNIQLNPKDVNNYNYMDIFEYKSDIDYVYITNYDKSGNNILEHKIQQVFTFIGILKGSFLSESQNEIHKETFDNLRLLGVTFPNFNNIVDELEAELNRIDRRFSNRFKPQIQKYMSLVDPISENVTQQLGKLYKMRETKLKSLNKI